MPAVVELHNVTKRYPGTDLPALQSVDLTIDRGLITAIMGPSGCGKSTLLNLIGALDRPTEGEIVLDDIRVDRLSESESARIRRQKVGYIFQFFQLLDDLTVRDNVAIAAQLAGISRSDSRRRALVLLEELGLDERADRYPQSLSGGERQRVAIARAIINSPAVVLADEPTGALDSHNGEQVLALLEDLNRRGQTVVLVTHDERLAGTRAHRLIRLSDGQITRDERLAPVVRVATEGQAA